MARKPLECKSVAENVLKWGTGGINIDESRVGFDAENENFGKEVRDYGEKAGGQWQKGKQERSVPPNTGRFPANLIHDNSEEVRECFPESKSTGGTGEKSKGKMGTLNWEGQATGGFGDSGNASRFFKSIIYQSKASKRERNKGCEGLEEKDSMKWAGGNEMKGLAGKYPDGTPRPIQIQKNNHPTVKPIALMEYLIKMVTPKGGIVLDPFAGSGTTGVACHNLKRNFILIEKEPDYCKIAEERLKNLQQTLI
jgi:site-specific DNA-methyltransferase (adenine-specific)